MKLGPSGMKLRSLFSQVEHYAAVSMQAAWRMKRVFAMMQKLVKVRRQMEALALQAKADEEGDDLATLQQEVARTRRGLQREVSRRMDNAGEERELLSSPSRFELDREQVREAEAPSRARARRPPLSLFSLTRALSTRARARSRSTWTASRRRAAAA